MREVFLHQLRDHLRSLRFQVSLAALVAFFVCNGLVYALKGARLAQEDARIQADMGRDYQQVATVGQAADQGYRVLRPATGREFIVEAGFNWLQDALWVSPASGQTMWSFNLRTTNNWMRRFEVIDWALIGRYVLSFLCIVLAYNAVSGELESGTLRLVLANPLSRASFLVGKFLAHLLTLGAATALGSLLSLLILVLNNAVEMNAELGRACLFFLLGAAFYAALFLLLAMGVSALARSSATSLVLLVTAWTLVVVVVPQTSYLVARRIGQHSGDLWERIDRYEQEYHTSLQNEGLVPRPVELARSDNYALERRYVQRLHDLEKELDRMRREIDGVERRQYEIARRVNLISPSFAFQYGVEALLGTGLERYESFRGQGWRYRETLRQFLRGRDQDDPHSPHLHFLGGFMSGEELDEGDLPRFKEQPLTFSENLEAGVVPMLMLLLESLLAFFFALWAFNRAELTG